MPKPPRSPLPDARHRARHTVGLILAAALLIGTAAATASWIGRRWGIVLGEASPWLLGIFLSSMAIVSGGAVGSFLNVVVYRLPRGESIVWEPSHCPRCGHPIRPRHNVPIFGWLVLRGKCYDCGQPIAARYAWVEWSVAAMFLFLLVFSVPTPSDSAIGIAGSAPVALVLLAARATLVSMLLAAGLITYDKNSIPPGVQWFAGLAGIVLVAALAAVGRPAQRDVNSASPQNGASTAENARDVESSDEPPSLPSPGAPANHLMGGVVALIHILFLSGPGLAPGIGWLLGTVLGLVETAGAMVLLISLLILLRMRRSPVPPDARGRTYFLLLAYCLMAFSVQSFVFSFP